MTVGPNFWQLGSSGGQSTLGEGIRTGLRGNTDPSSDSNVNYGILTAQILEGLLTASNPQATPSSELSNALRQGTAANLAQAFQQLPPERQAAYRNQLGSGQLQELISLSEETDAHIFHSDLINVGLRLRQRQKLAEAGMLFAFVSQQAPVHLTGIRQRAQENLTVLQGEGGLGAQLELASESFVEQATDPVMLGSMIGAQATFGLSRLALLRSLPQGSRIARLAVANTAAFGLEGLAFVGSHHGLNHAIGRSNPNPVPFAQELGHTYLTLGLLKVFGGGANSALRARFAGRLPASLTAAERFTQAALPRAAMFGGIYTAGALAPSLGLGPEMDQGSLLFSSLVTLLHFEVAGQLMNGIPGLAAFNQRVHHETDLAIRDSLGSGQRLWGQLQDTLTLPGPELVMNNGIRISDRALEGRQAPNILMMSSEGEEANGSAPASIPSSIPPVSGVRSRPTPETVRPTGTTPTETPSSRPKPLMQRLVEWHMARGEVKSRKEVTRRQDPSEPVTPIRRESLPTPVRSMADGILRSMARGEGQRQIAFTRRVLDLTRDMPLTRESYLALETQRLAYQQRIRESLDPILQKLDIQELSQVSEAVIGYEQSIERNLGSGTPKYEADALLYLRQAERMSDPAYREGLSDADMRRMGYEPNALEDIVTNGDKFPTGMVESIIRNNPQLRDAPGAERILTTFGKHDPTSFSLRNGIRLGTPFRTLFENPSIGRLWLSEVALHSSIREIMQRNPDRFVERVLDQVESTPGEISETQSIPDLARRMNEFREASRNLKIAQATQGHRKDFGQVHRARGQYELKLADLLLHHANALVPHARTLLGERLQSIPESKVQDLSQARENLWTRYQEYGDQSRAQFEELAPQINEFIRVADTELVPLREQGMRVGMSHVSELLGKIRDQVGEDVFNRDIAPRWEEIQNNFELYLHGLEGENRGQPIDPNRPHLIGYHPAAREALNGKVNPRDFNRNIEEPLKQVMAGYSLAVSQAKAHDVSLGSVRRIIPLFESYAHKADLSREVPKATRYRNLVRYYLAAYRRIVGLNSVRRFNYPFSEGARLFLDFGASLGNEIQPQTFFHQQGIEPVADYFRYAISGDHNTHLDFIGHADNIVQANLGPRAQPHSIPDIIAKLDLSIPMIEQVFPYLTNMIGNDSSGMARSFHRAVTMQALGSLAEGRHQPTMPLAYDNITMDVTNGDGPYTRDPASPVTGSLPVLGRLFQISEGASVVTGRPQGIMFVQDPGALRNYPSQRGGPALLRNPSSMASLFLPMTALPRPVRGEKITLRNNAERLIWYLQAFHPEINPPAPDTNRIFEAYSRPLDAQTEDIVANLFRGAWEVYPTREGIQNLETQRRTLSRTVAEARDETTPEIAQARRDLTFINRALDLHTRRLLQNRMTVLEDRLATELADPNLHPEYKGLRRMQRILRSRRRTLDSIERKVAKEEPLSLTERRFIEKMSTALAGRDVVSGRDHTLAALEFYFQAKDQGKTVQEAFKELQQEYTQFVHDWNEARKDSNNPEFHQLHISEAEGHNELQRRYFTSIESLYGIHGMVPSRWNGAIFPDIEFIRDGNRTLVQHLGREPSDRFSAGAIWSYLFKDTAFGIVPLATHSPQFDNTPQLYLDLHRAWGYHTLNRFQTRWVLENTDRLRSVANKANIVAPTHDSGAEFAATPAILIDYGIKTFFMADQKFFDEKGPIRRILGDMEAYGHFPIQRGGGKRQALDSMKASGDFVTGRPYTVAGRERNHEPRSLIIFPGGTRTPVRYNRNRAGFRGRIMDGLNGLTGGFLDGFLNRVNGAPYRYEGPIYGNKKGIALTFARANSDGAETAVVPIGVIGGSVMYPKEGFDSLVFGGAAIGRDQRFNFGHPITRQNVSDETTEPNSSQINRGIVERLNEQFAELTGREVGPPAGSKSKK